MPYNFVADSVYTKKLCSRLSSSKVQVKPRTSAIPERLRSVFTTRRYKNPRLLYLYFTLHGKGRFAFLSLHLEVYGQRAMLPLVLLESV